MSEAEQYKSSIHSGFMFYGQCLTVYIAIKLPVLWKSTTCARCSFGQRLLLRRGQLLVQIVVVRHLLHRLQVKIHHLDALLDPFVRILNLDKE